VRASERYSVLEFGFNLNQWYSGVGTRGRAFPHLFFGTTHLGLGLRFKTLGL